MQGQFFRHVLTVRKHLLFSILNLNYLNILIFFWLLMLNSLDRDSSETNMALKLLIFLINNIRIILRTPRGNSLLLLVQMVWSRSLALHPLIKLSFIIINFGHLSMYFILSAIDKVTESRLVDSLRVLRVHGSPFYTIQAHTSYDPLVVYRQIFKLTIEVIYSYNFFSILKEFLVCNIIVRFSFLLLIIFLIIWAIILAHCKICI